MGIFNDLANAPQSIAAGVCSTIWITSGENCRIEKKIDGWKDNKKKRETIEKKCSSNWFTWGNKNGQAQSILLVKSVDGRMEKVTYSSR